MLDGVFARLAAGAKGRTEADIQSDVRALLLLARLDLDGDDLTEVKLEAQADGRRIDVEVGATVIEVKKTLERPGVVETARVQLQGYVQHRQSETGGRYVGILTDGRRWVLYHLGLDGMLSEADRCTLGDPEAGPRLVAWLEGVLATGHAVTATPAAVLASLGAEAPGTQLDLLELRSLYAECRDVPEVQLKRQLWGRLLSAALGDTFDVADDDLFVTHTYLVMTAELIAHAVAGVPISVGDIRALLEGRKFAEAGLHGVVEADFFDWPAVHSGGGRLVGALARRIGRFDWTSVEHDILKVLYESVIDADTRHHLGEYYTPDWLAQRIVSTTVTDPLNQRVLDPSCGSGTFLFWAVRHYLAAADNTGIANHRALAGVTRHVFGIDLHPVAVTLARVTYLLAIGPTRLQDREELSIPVYLGDSVRWEQDDTLTNTGGLEIRTADEMTLVDETLSFPAGVLEDATRFDRLIADLADRAASGAEPVGMSDRRTPQSPTAANPGKRGVPSIKALLNKHKVPDEYRNAITEVFSQLFRLYVAGRDHIWGYYIRNLARPLLFTRTTSRVDVLIGNPPWLSYRHMGKLNQGRYRALATARGLLTGGKVATHQDLSDLFVVRTVEQYLASGGRFAFVMPFAVLSRRQYEGFRTGNYTSQGYGTLTVAFDTPDDYSAVRHAGRRRAVFPVPCCVVHGTRSAPGTPMPAIARKWTGTVPSPASTWDSAREHLSETSATARIAQDWSSSPYHSRFRQGATIVPSVLLRVEVAPASPGLGQARGRRSVRSLRSNLEKPPWKDLPTLEGVIEEQFVMPMHLGSTIAPFRPLEPQNAVVPWNGTRLLGDRTPGPGADLDEFPGLEAWWSRAEALWAAHRKRSTTMSLRAQIDYHGKMTGQFPPPPLRVVYTASGTTLAACLITDSAAVLEHKLYWGPVDTHAEGHYLVAILNSNEVRDAVTPLMSVGDFGPRDFDKYVFHVPFPAFSPDKPDHVAVANLGQRAAAAAQNVNLDASWDFKRSRKEIRKALLDDGVTDDIDRAVADLLHGLM